MEIEGTSYTMHTRERIFPQNFQRNGEVCRKRIRDTADTPLPRELLIVSYY